MEFSDAFLNLLGAWQRGWREDQSRRNVLATNLLQASLELEPQFRKVACPCFRKKFLHQGELTDWTSLVSIDISSCLLWTYC